MSSTTSLRAADPVASDVAAVDLERILKALASARRLMILDWLRDPAQHFPPQVHGDPVEHGACNQYIVDKLGVSQPAASRHLKVLVDAGLVIATPRQGWTYYRRDESGLAEVSDLLARI